MMFGVVGGEGADMRRSRLLGYVLLGALAYILVSTFFNFVFPVILDSGLLFGGLVALLLVSGLVMAVISARRMFRR